MSRQTGSDADSSGGSAQPAWLELVQQQVASLKFGTVQITVHDSRVSQVERLERLRFDKPEVVKNSSTRPRV